VRPLIAVLVTLIATLGFVTKRGGTAPAIEVGAIDRLFASRTTSLGGEVQTLNQWRGKLLVVNYWATWCAPCREELPALARLSSQFAQRGVQVIGIAIDSAENVRQYISTNPSAYPLVIGDPDALALSKSLGNALLGLPFTVIIDPSGRLHHRQLGAVNEAQMAEWIRQVAAAASASSRIPTPD
jgi:peroxiredoxin